MRNNFPLVLSLWDGDQNFKKIVKDKENTDNVAEYKEVLILFLDDRTIEMRLIQAILQLYISVNN